MYYDYINKERRIVQFDRLDKEDRPFSTFFSNDEKCDGNYKQNKVPIPFSHSSAFVDIDADCQNDLLIESSETDPKTKKTLEIWRGQRIHSDSESTNTETNSIKYCLTTDSIYKLDDNLGQFTIADINRDGLLDIIFPVMYSSKLLIALNKIDLVYDWSDDFCKVHFNPKLNNLTTIFEPLDNKDAKATNFTWTVTLSENEEFYQKDLIKPILKAGDINSDGYPDIIATMYKKSDKKQTAKIYINTQLGEEKKNRTFNKNETLVLPVDDVIMATFFDIDENGQLDIILMTRITNNKNNEEFRVYGFYNNYIYDAFFLKSVTLLRKNIFVSNELGANYRYITTKLDGKRKMDVSYQNIQVGNDYLSLPYSFIGIGRSNNYIENFHVITISANGNDESYKMFTPIIPNSQLIISKELTGKIPETTDWQLDLIVKPTSKLSLLIIVIAIILGVILTIVIYLHIKEVQEDKETENKNFNAWYS